MLPASDGLHTGSRPASILYLLLVLLAIPIAAKNIAGSFFSKNGIPEAWDNLVCPSYGKSISTPASPDPGSTSVLVPPRRPSPRCRTFNSTGLESLLSKIKPRFRDEKLATLFENAITQTLDTTVRWYSASPTDSKAFIVTGDIPAEWLRDSSNQMNVYLPLIEQDEALRNLILGVINLQAKYITQYAFCNAFRPPPESHITIDDAMDQEGTYEPGFDPNVAWTCELEVDGLASFLALSIRYFNISKQADFMTPNWLKSVEIVLKVFEDETRSTFDETGHVTNTYNFTKPTKFVINHGIGSPQLFTGLVGTSMRPSDDPVLFPFNVPTNALVAVQTAQLEQLLNSVPVPQATLAQRAGRVSKSVTEGLNSHALIVHPVWGKVYAYEVDGFGSTAVMDDANCPSLLSLTYLGWEPYNSKTFRSTRRMLMSRKGNPYFFNGTQGFGIGSPHTGIPKIWPMSLVSFLFASESDEEILTTIKLLISSTQGYGVLHESFDAFKPGEFSRPWFAWVNSYFAEAILYLAQVKPHLVFKDPKPFLISKQGNLASFGGLYH